MKKYKFISMYPSGYDVNGKPSYIVLANRGDRLLGYIEWHGNINRLSAYYEFHPTANACFDRNCLTDVIDFLDNYAGKEEGKL